MGVKKLGVVNHKHNDLYFATIEKLDVKYFFSIVRVLDTDTVITGYPITTPVGKIDRKVSECIEQALKLKTTSALRKKLKKGINPESERYIDAYLWPRYHDAMTKYFKQTYSSFGKLSLVSYFRINSMLTKMDKTYFETNYYINLLELRNSNIITEKDLENLSLPLIYQEARLAIIKKIEKSLKIFIYQQDLDLMVEYLHFFQLFILSLTARQFLLKKTTLIDTDRFLIPVF